MLVLGRREGQKIFIGKDRGIVIQVVEISRGQVKLGIDADKRIPVVRDDAERRNNVDIGKR